MKSFTLFIFIFLSPFFLLATPYSNKEILKKLDETIRHRPYYSQQKEDEIKEIKERIATDFSPQEFYWSYNHLFHSYLTFQTDSAFHYLQKKYEISQLIDNIEFQEEVKMNFAEVMSVTGMYKEALEMLDEVDKSNLSEGFLTYYYHLYRFIYGLMSDYVVTPREKEKYTKLVDTYRDSLLLIHPENSLAYILVATDQMISNNQTDRAIESLQHALDSCDDKRKEGLLAYQLSEAYGKKKEKNQQIYYLAISSICDLELAVKEYLSLQKLATLMYEEKEIDRAYNYLTCSMEDAVFCNARLRATEVAQMFPIIDQAYQLKEESRKRTRLILLVCISGFCFCMILIVIYIYLQMRKISSIKEALSITNKQLQETNKQLSESNIIKDEYIARYLDQCTRYLDKMESYRRSLAKLAMGSRLEELFKTIKSTQFIEEERAEFYKGFDKTFLNLFPGFIEEFNNLLIPEAKIEPKSGELLTTELRIFALIRLGITDSNKIAQFLDYSLTTIYNYRSKIRNKAKGDKNNFEEMVMGLK